MNAENSHYYNYPQGDLESANQETNQQVPDALASELERALYYAKPGCKKCNGKGYVQIEYKGRTKLFYCNKSGCAEFKMKRERLIEKERPVYTVTRGKEVEKVYLEKSRG